MQRVVVFASAEGLPLYRYMWYKQRTSFTLSVQAKQLLAQLAVKSGISRTAVLEMLIREKAKKKDVN